MTEWYSSYYTLAVHRSTTFEMSHILRLALWHPYFVLTRIYGSKNQQDKAIETAWNVLMSLGFTIKRQNPLSLKPPFEIDQWSLMEDCLIQTWVHLWTAYAHVAPDLCEKAGEYAKITYRICIGEDDTFDDKYGKLAHQAMFEGWVKHSGQPVCDVIDVGLTMPSRMSPSPD